MRRPGWYPLSAAQQLAITGVLGMAGLWAIGSASAAIGPSADPASRVQRFRYDAEASFAILALPGVPTDLQLAPDEHVTGFALGDTLQWMVEELPGHVFVKPLKADLFTAGTLVTDRRTYQLTLRSGHGQEAWMQRVSWSYPDLVVLRSGPMPLPHGAEVVPAAPSAALAAAPPPPRSALSAPGVDPVQLDFDYRSTGDQNIRPQAVFDDGRSTWLRMRGGESLPALYLEDASGERLVPYAVRGDWLVAPRIAAVWVLRAGGATVRVARHPGGARQDQSPPAAFWR